MGTGPHLCFLHGFCEDSSIWDKLVDELKAKYTCLTIDIPGFGKSSSLRMPSIPEVAIQINALLQHENIQICTLFGHSMGGYVAAEYLSQFPDQLSAVGFIHSTVRSDSDLKKANRLKTISFIETYGSAEFFKVFAPSLVASHNLPALKDELTRLVNSTSNQSIVDGLIAMKNREDKVPFLKSFKKPILFLKGELDEHYPEQEIYNQASLTENVQLSVLSDTGHLSMFECPTQCHQEISTFLQFSEDLLSTAIS